MHSYGDQCSEVIKVAMEKIIELSLITNVTVILSLVIVCINSPQCVI